MLFNRDDISKAKVVEPTAKGVKSALIGQKSLLAYDKAAKELAQYVGEIQENTVIRAISKGQWSMHDLIKYAALQIGEPCKLFLTTWTVTQQPVEALFQLHKEGIITDIYALFDYRIKERKPEAFQFLNSFSKAIALGKCHAKVSVLIGEKKAISIYGSGNLSKNPRLEAYVIFSSYETAKQDELWIMQEITQKKN